MNWLGGDGDGSGGCSCCCCCCCCCFFILKVAVCLLLAGIIAKSQTALCEKGETHQCGKDGVEAKGRGWVWRVGGGGGWLWEGDRLVMKTYSDFSFVMVTGSILRNPI